MQKYAVIFHDYSWPPDKNAGYALAFLTELCQFSACRRASNPGTACRLSGNNKKV
jgi:hypothetical protein